MSIHMYRLTLLFVFQCVELRKVPAIELPTGKDLPRNQSKVEQPSKAELVQKQQTRLKLGNTNL